MANKMINCKTCGEEMAASAKACPKCGAKNKKPIYKKPMFYVLIILVIAIAAGVGSVNAKKASKNIPIVVTYANGTVATEKLHDIKELSKTNEAQFQEKYKLAGVTFTDEVMEISGATIINGKRVEGVITTKSAIEIRVLKDDNGEIAKLNVGDKITVTSAGNISRGYTTSLVVYINSPNQITK